MAEPTPLLLRGLTNRPGAREITLSHRELLGRRLLFNSLARFAVSAIFVASGVAALELDLLDPAAASAMTGLGLFVAFYNFPIFLLARRHHEPKASELEFHGLHTAMCFAIVVDYLVLAALVTLMGGARSPFLAFYLLHVTLSCVMLSRRAAIAFTGLAFSLIAAQVGMEWANVLGSTGPFAHAVPMAPLGTQEAVSVLLVYGALLVFTDALLIPMVDWLRRSEWKLREKNERLDKLSRLRRDFLHVAVHNLRAPVGATAMHLENLSAGLAGPLGEKQQEWVDRGLARLHRLLDLLQDLKILGDLETDSVDDGAEWLDLHELAEEIAGDLQDVADGAGLVLVPERTGKPPQVLGIRRLLREAMANYVTNAIRYAPGTGAVTLRTELMDPGGEAWVRTSVIDRGPGIPPEHRERLFEEFSRAPGATDPDTPKGMGLGLSIVRRVVEAHRGRVGVESAPGGGSTFWFELPAEQTEAASRSADAGAEESE